MTLTVINKAVQLSELEAWGPVADMGSAVLEGDVRPSAR